MVGWGCGLGVGVWLGVGWVRAYAVAHCYKIISVPRTLTPDDNSFDKKQQQIFYRQPVDAGTENWSPVRYDSNKLWLPAHLYAPPPDITDTPRHSGKPRRCRLFQSTNRNKCIFAEALISRWTSRRVWLSDLSTSHFTHSPYVSDCWKSMDLSTNWGHGSYGPPQRVRDPKSPERRQGVKNGRREVKRHRIEHIKWHSDVTRYDVTRWVAGDYRTSSDLGLMIVWGETPLPLVKRCKGPSRN